jgi:hypothetical protein
MVKAQLFIDILTEILEELQTTSSRFQASADALPPRAPAWPWGIPAWEAPQADRRDSCDRSSGRRGRFIVHLLEVGSAKLLAH